MPSDYKFSAQELLSFLPDSSQQPPQQGEAKRIMANKFSPPWTNLVGFGVFFRLKFHLENNFINITHLLSAQGVLAFCLPGAAGPKEVFNPLNKEQ